MVKINALKKYIIILVAFLCSILMAPIQAKAGGPLDEILNYDMIVDLNEDASVNIQYRIAWKVLDSDSEGPLDWVKIGMPKEPLNYEAVSDNIDHISVNNSGGHYLNVYFKDKYYAGDVVDFSFNIQADELYIMNTDTGITEYYFTPGWFDGITVDEMTIRWNCDKATGWSPQCVIEDGYCTWNQMLTPGEKFEVTVKYPNDAYAFKVIEEKKEGFWDYVVVFIGIILILFISVAGGAIMLLPVIIPVVIGLVLYKKYRGFDDCEKKITRTKIEYYSNCPGCGASRADGQDKCSYCGHDMIKSKTIIDETKIPKEEKDKLDAYKTSGKYRYGSDPNTYVFVDVARIPRPKPTTTHTSSSHRSSCVHSSCACACACACAGGGRAGCTTKDFYNTRLKLVNIIKKRSK